MASKSVGQEEEGGDICEVTAGKIISYLVGKTSR